MGSVAEGVRPYNTEMVKSGVAVQSDPIMLEPHKNCTALPLELFIEPKMDQRNRFYGKLLKFEK